MLAKKLKLLLLACLLFVFHSLFYAKPDIKVQLGHKDLISSVTFSPNGKYVLSGSWDNTIKLWDIATGKEIRTFIGHNNGVVSVRFSLDGKYILSGAGDTMNKGIITITNLTSFIESEVPEVTYNKWGYEQIPMKELPKEDFPIGMK